MKYETPELKVIAFEATESIANDNEIEEGFGGLISPGSMPTA